MLTVCGHNIVEFTTYCDRIWLTYMYIYVNCHNIFTILSQYGDNMASFSQYGEHYGQYMVTILWPIMRKLVMFQYEKS